MTDPVKLLVLSRDETLFFDGGVQGDARLRHIRYAEVLREVYGPASEIRIIAYSKAHSANRRDEPAPGLKLYGTSSFHRAFYTFDVCRLLPEVFSGGWKPTAVTVQTPWEEGVVGALLAPFVGAAFLPQLHFDLLSDKWLSEHTLNPLRRVIALQVLRAAKRIRVVSEPLKSKLVQRTGFPAGRVDVIPVGVNFIPSSLSSPAAKHALDPRLVGHQVILFVGRLTAQKNLGMWLDVAADVLVAEPSTKFVIVGDGEQRDMLQRTITARGQSGSILLTGPISHQRLPDIYAAADIFLLTSHYEGFGRVVLEAGMASVPCVATRCAGPEDIIEDGRSGILTKREDRSASAAACLALLRDPVRRREMGQLAQQLAYERFSLTALATRLSHHWAAG